LKKRWRSNGKSKPANQSFITIEERGQAREIETFFFPKLKDQTPKFVCYPDDAFF
jgi:hypothetical protein